MCSLSPTKVIYDFGHATPKLARQKAVNYVPDSQIQDGERWLTPRHGGAGFRSIRPPAWSIQAKRYSTTGPRPMSSALLIAPSIKPILVISSADRKVFRHILRLCKLPLSKMYPFTPSLMSSFAPQADDTTTGTPHIRASLTTTPHPSYLEGRTSKSNSESVSLTSSEETGVNNEILPELLSANTFNFSAAEPAPMTVSSNSVKCFQSGSSASINRSILLRSTN